MALRLALVTCVVHPLCQQSLGLSNPGPRAFHHLRVVIAGKRPTLVVEGGSLLRRHKSQGTSTNRQSDHKHHKNTQPAEESQFFWFFHRYGPSRALRFAKEKRCLFDLETGEAPQSGLLLTAHRNMFALWARVAYAGKTQLGLPLDQMTYANCGPGAPCQAAVSSPCRKMVARQSREPHRQISGSRLRGVMLCPQR
jgi:hypothetical protein